MSRRRRGRGLSAEERALWRQVADSAQPLHNKPPRTPKASGAAPFPQTPARPAAPAAFRIGERAATGVGLTLPAPAAAPEIADRRTRSRLRRGKLRPEARLDLHGLTLDEAQPALTRFLLGAHERGLRLVLVITGKGRGLAAAQPFQPEGGVLRRHLPLWLGRRPLAPLVQGHAEAHPGHGGGGAFYVWLRARRG